MREQYAALPLLLDPVLSTPAALQPGAFPCPKCGKALRRQKSRQNADEFFWSCSDADCRTFLPDEDGKSEKPREKAAPSEHPCPVCGRPHYSGKNDRGHEELHKRTDALAAEMGMQINVTRQEVFDAMHTI